MSDPIDSSSQDLTIQDTAGKSTLDVVSSVSASDTQDAESAAALAPDARNIVPISFDGTTKQYFNLFIVNLLLTIITLGIYSAWARVRTRRFFLGHTYIGKHNLEFDARPVDILVSRILVVIVVGGLLFAEYRFDLIWSGVGVFLVGVLLLMPFALVRGRAFIARHTIHRTVRFRYRLEYRRPVILYIGYAFFAILVTYVANTTSTAIMTEDFDITVVAPLIVSLIAAGLTFPVLIHFGHRIQIDQLQLGKLCFSHAGSIKHYYSNLAKAFYVSLGMLFLLSFVVIAITGILSAIIYLLMNIASYFSGYGDPGISLLKPLFLFISAVIVPIVTVLSYMVGIAPYRAALICLYWRYFRIGSDSTIESSLEFWPLVWLLVVNYSLIIVSLGLMYPWARVRFYRHVAERLQIRLGPETAAAYFSSADDLTPLAGEFADVTGWDFDFGAI